MMDSHCLESNSGSDGIVVVKEEPKEYSSETEGCDVKEQDIHIVNIAPTVTTQNKLHDIEENLNPKQVLPYADIVGDGLQCPDVVHKGNQPTVERPNQKLGEVDRENLISDTIKHLLVGGMASTDVVQRNTAQRDAAQGDVAERDALQREAAQRDAAQRDTAQRDAAQRDAAQRDAAQRDAACDMDCNDDKPNWEESDAASSSAEYVAKGEKPRNICRYCGKIFPEQEELTVHEHMHTGKRPYSCLTCAKTFTCPAYLNRHKRTHTGEKPYSCTICGKAYSQQGQLTIHKRIHTGEKPYACSTCGKSFIQQGSLNVHMRSHNLDEKPYRCTMCGKAFMFQAYLNRHMRMHTGEKPYSCATCGKSFSQQGQLTIHNRGHCFN